MYELNGGDGPLKEDGLIGSRTQKVIGALTTYFSALDYVESLGKATGQSVPAAGLFQEEDEETGNGANLVSVGALSSLGRAMVSNEFNKGASPTPLGNF